MELLSCCVGGAQNAFERIEEVDGLAKRAIDVVNNVIGKGNDMKQINETISTMLKERPSPTSLIKVPGMCKDAADLANGMTDLSKDCCECAVEISQNINEVLDSRCSMVMKIIGGSDDGKSDDDPEAANTEADCIELRELKDAIVGGNPFTIVKEGYDCVEGIRKKVGVVETLCSALQTFGEAITTITSDILALDVEKILGKIADMSRMLRLSDMLAQFAAEMLKLVECVGEVFGAVMDKISHVLPNMSGLTESAGVVADIVGDVSDNFKDMVPEKMGNMIGKYF